MIFAEQEPITTPVHGIPITAEPITTPVYAIPLHPDLNTEPPAELYKSRLCESIMVCLFCSCLFGCGSLILSIMATSNHDEGNARKANSYNKMARNLNIIGAIFGSISLVIGTIFWSIYLANN